MHQQPRMPVFGPTTVAKSSNRPTLDTTSTVTPSRLTVSSDNTVAGGPPAEVPAQPHGRDSPSCPHCDGLNWPALNVITDALVISEGRTSPTAPWSILVGVDEMEVPLAAAVRLEDAVHLSSDPYVHTGAADDC